METHNLSKDNLRIKNEFKITRFQTILVPNFKDAVELYIIGFPEFAFSENARK